MSNEDKRAASSSFFFSVVVVVVVLGLLSSFGLAALACLGGKKLSKPSERGRFEEEDNHQRQRHDDDDDDDHDQLCGTTRSSLRCDQDDNDDPGVQGESKTIVVVAARGRGPEHASLVAPRHGMAPTRPYRETDRRETVQSRAVVTMMVLGCIAFLVREREKEGRKEGRKEYQTVWLWLPGRETGKSLGECVSE